MGTITLDDRDRAILARLRRGDADVDALAESVDSEESSLRDRLPELADNGLVLRVHGDLYTITANGKRVLAASPAGTTDDRIDTPPDVEDRLASFDLRPDREAAVRNAFTFLRYWGAATGGEIVDGVYSENPAGFASSEAWWTECVGRRLADLPLVDPPGSDELEWRYAATPTVEHPSDDGRGVTDGVADRASVRDALERADLTDDERAAVRAAFDVLVREGTVNADELEARIYPDFDAGYGSSGAWWSDCVREAFGSLPGVDQRDGSSDSWEYRDDIER